MADEEVVFLAQEKDGTSVVKVLGVTLNCRPNELRIFVNGKELTTYMVVEEVKVTLQRKAET